MFASLRRGMVAGITVAALVFGLGIFPTAVTMAQSALAAPAEPSISFQPLVGVALPYFIEIFLTLMFGLAVLVSRWVKNKWGVDTEARLREIEAKHRDSLHSAIYTSVANQIAQGRLGTLQVNVGSKALAEVTNYLLESTPDAMKRFNPSPDILSQIATKAAVELQAKLAPSAGSAIGGLLEAFQPARPHL